jgi:TPR repeat protein
MLGLAVGIVAGVVVAGGGVLLVKPGLLLPVPPAVQPPPATASDTAKLAASQTQLSEAQKQVEDQRGRLRDLEARDERAEKALAAETDAAAKAQAQIDQMNSQVQALRDQVAGLQAKPAPAPAPAAEGEASWTIDQKREIQRALRTLGHYQGDADAGFGGGTQSAIREFQAFDGIAETGTLTEDARKTLVDMGERLSALLDQPATSPEGVAGSSIKGSDQRYARAWNYDNGKSVKADPAEAAYWYALAAGDGEAKAFTNLGTLVARGWGTVKPDPQDAALLWWAAAARGEAIATYDLGVLYERGIGVTADLARAKAWYTRAAILNHPDARAALKRLSG